MVRLMLPYEAIYRNHETCFCSEDDDEEEVRTVEREEEFDFKKFLSR